MIIIIDRWNERIITIVTISMLLS